MDGVFDVDGYSATSVVSGAIFGEGFVIFEFVRAYSFKVRFCKQMISGCSLSISDCNYVNQL